MQFGASKHPKGFGVQGSKDGDQSGDAEVAEGFLDVCQTITLALKSQGSNQ